MACGAEMKEPRARIVAFSKCLRRVATAALWGLTLAGLFACSKRDGAVRSTTAQSTATDDSPAAGAEPRRVPKTEIATQLPAPDLFERGAQHDFELSTQLLRAIPPQFSRADIEAKTLFLSNFSPSSSLWLAVDQHSPRRARKAQFTVAELLNEDVELAPGSHYLMAFEWGGEEPQRLQLAAFFVDVEPTSLPLSPGCVLATPKLTKNGSEAKEPLRFLAVPLVANIDRVEYRAQVGELRSRGEAPAGTEMLLKNLPAGDVTLEAECYGGSEKLGSDEQIVTVNPDALDPEVRP